MNETDQREIEQYDDELDAEISKDSKTTFLGYALIVVQAIWIAARWTSLKVLDVSLWLILSFTENQRAVRPTIRATFSKAERAAIPAIQVPVLRRKTDIRQSTDRPHGPRVSRRIER